MPGLFHQKDDKPTFQLVSPTPSSRGAGLYLKVSALLKILTDIDVMPQEFLNSLSFHVSVARGVKEHTAKMSNLGNHTRSGVDANSQISTALCPVDIVFLSSSAN